MHLSSRQRAAAALALVDATSTWMLVAEARKLLVCIPVSGSDVRKVAVHLRLHWRSCNGQTGRPAEGRSGGHARDWYSGLRELRDWRFLCALTFELRRPWRQTPTGRGRTIYTMAWSGQAVAAVAGRRLEREVRARATVCLG
jgi:hypothetical protein